jgi:hypothetical protein
MQPVYTSEPTAALKSIPFTSVDETDVQSRLSGALTLSARIIKADQTSVVGAGTFDQPDSVNAPGCRRYVMASADSSVVGPGIVRISATGMEPREVPFVALGFAPHAEPGARQVGWLAIKNGETAAARMSVPFTAVTAADLQTRMDADALSFTVRIIKADGTSVAGAGTVVHPDDTNARGCCFYVGDAADFDVNGETIIHISAAAMETREITVTVVAYDPYLNRTAPAVIANSATAESIRDRVIALVEGITPTSLAGDKFRRYRNEGAADFDEAMENKPAAAFRRFQVRQVGDEENPDVSNAQFEAVVVSYEFRMAYPQNHRYGAANGMDRDDVINQDWLQFNRAIGIYGRGNFTGSHDCTPLGAVKTRESGNAVDYLVVTARFRYQRTTG